MTIQELKQKVYEKDLQIIRLKSNLTTKEEEMSFLIGLLDKRQMEVFEQHLKQRIHEIREQSKKTINFKKRRYENRI